MNEKKFKEKLVEFLVELSKPKKFEVGFVQGNKIINDGLVILGMNATDILGFAKPDNERRIRRTRGTQAWFKHMYNNGWRYAGTFEQEGLQNNGFVVMERELPNRTLDAIREELQILLRDEDVLTVTPDAPMSFISKSQLNEVDSESWLAIQPSDRAEIKKRNDFENLSIAKLEGKIPIGSKVDVIPQAEGLDIARIPKAVKEPREGFESDVNDFMIDAKKEMKTTEELFFEETGKNAIWRGKETIAFKEWKKELNL